jgi:alkylation response protein AidB-like acyl-CoA dehydrogenase
MARGEAIGAIAMTEPGAGSDLKAIRTRAVRQGEHYLLNGQKTWISNGSNADVAVVVATVAPELGARGLSLFCVETALPGVTRGAPMAKIGQHAQDTSELFFQDVAVPVSHLLGEEQRGFDYLGEQLAAERLAIALRAAASAEGMLDETLAYVRQRKAFGRHLIDHQNTRFVLADAASRLAMLRSFLDQCLDAHMHGRLQATTAAMARPRRSHGPATAAAGANTEKTPAPIMAPSPIVTASARPSLRARGSVVISSSGVITVGANASVSWPHAKSARRRA